MALVTVGCLSLTGLGVFASPALAEETPTPDPSSTTASPSPDPAPASETPAPAPSPDPTPSPAPEASSPYLVAFTADTTPAERDTLLSDAGATDVSSIPQLRMASASLTASGVDALRADAGVVRVESDKVREVQGTPNDPAYADQWALPKIGWDSAYGTVDPAGSATVAVLDTGVDATEDLSGNLVPGASMLDGVAGTGDPNGHGTAMASIVAAQTDNGVGVAGVGYSGVSVMPVKVLGADGTGQDSDIVAGVVYAADHRADVILMSFSNPGRSQALQAAADYAWSKGAVLVAATGNDGSTTATYPAGLAKVVGVSATNRSDELWSGSNSGDDTFLGAPGVQIATGSGSGAVTGTSASAAVVAGVAALVRANDTAASNGVVVGRLARNADAAGTAAETGNGRVNLPRSLNDDSTDAVVPQGVAGNGGPVVGPYVVAAKNLDLTFVGTGGGSIAFSNLGPTPPALSPVAACTTTCTRSMENNNETGTMTVTPNPGSTFAGWSGTWQAGPQSAGTTTCAGTTTPCTFHMGNNGQALTATFTLATCSAPAVTTQPSAQSITYGAPASFSATASGSPAPAVQWQVSTNSGTSYSDIAGATSSPLNLTKPVVSTPAHLYRAVFTNTCSGTQTATTAGALLTVAPKALTVSGITAANKVYDGGTTATLGLASAAPVGVVSGDTVNLVTTSASGAFASAAVGTTKPVQVSGLTITGADAGNYTLTQPTTSANITAKPLTVSGAVANNKTYDALTAATVSFGSATLVGVVGIEDVTINSTGYGASFASKTVGTGKAVTVTGVALGGTSAGNYSVSQPTGLTANITPRALTTTGITAANKVYNGDTSATLNIVGPSLVGVQGTDAVILNTGSASGAFATAGVNTNKPVTVSGLTITGADAGNYTLTAPTPTANITPKPLTVTGAVANNKAYDASTAATVNFGDASLAGGVVSGDTVVIDSSGYAANFDTKAVGTSKPVTVTGVTLGGTSAGNYSVSQPTGLTANITAYGLTVTGITAANKVYDGGTGATLDVTAAQLVGRRTGDVVNLGTASASGAFASAGAGLAKSVQVSGLTISGADAANYTLTQPTTTADITKKPLTVTVDENPSTPAVDHFSRIYGAANPTFAARIAGFASGEDATALGGSLAFSTTATGTSNVGPYAVTPSGLTSSNYDISFVDGTLDVTKRPITVTAATQTKTYGDADPDLTYSVTSGNLVNGDAFIGALDRVPGESVAGSPYPIRRNSLSAGSNYELTYVGANLSIGQRALSVTADANTSTAAVDGFSRSYGNANPSFMVRYVGFAAGDNASVLGGTLGFATPAVATSPVGSYSVTPNGLTSSNYAISFVPGTLEVTARPITVTADPQTKVYGAADPTLTYAGADELVNGDVFTGGLVRVTGESVAGSPYAISQGTLSAGSNYNLTYAGANLSITRGAVDGDGGCRHEGLWRVEPDLHAVL